MLVWSCGGVKTIWESRRFESQDVLEAGLDVLAVSAQLVT
jgi:hypothetical protein